jgi:hypothetical protein
VIPEPAPRPEADVLGRIDQLVDEQLALGERWLSGDDKCPVCRGQWHGLPGDGHADMAVEGTSGAESYRQTGNGGESGCPGAHAISAARIRWRWRYRHPGPFLWQTSRPGQPRVRYWDADYNEITPYVDQVQSVRRRTGCHARDDGTCPWPSCPRDSLYEDTVLAMQMYSLGCPPRPERRRRNPIETFQRVVNDIVTQIANVMGLSMTARLWLPGDDEPPEPEPPEPVPIASLLQNIHFYGVVTGPDGEPLTATLEITGDNDRLVLPLVLAGEQGPAGVPPQPFSWRPVVVTDADIAPIAPTAPWVVFREEPHCEQCRRHMPGMTISQNEPIVCDECRDMRDRAEDLMEAHIDGQPWTLADLEELRQREWRTR